MIKTIIFDIGGVVTRADFRAIYSNFAKRAGLSPEFVIGYHKDHLDDLLLGTITAGKFWQDMIDAGADPDLDLEAIWIDEGLKNRKVNDGLLDIIKELRKKYSVGALTNLTAHRRIIDEKMDIYSHFDYVLLSFEEHMKKPDPAFYRLALARAGATPDEAIFVDDQEKCTSAAETIGIKSILYTYPDNAGFLAALKKLGVVVGT